jgi:hypothetical protein
LVCNFSSAEKEKFETLAGGQDYISVDAFKNDPKAFALEKYGGEAGRKMNRFFDDIIDSLQGQDGK